MIKEIIVMGREHVKKKVEAFVPPAILKEFYAAIVFRDPGKLAPNYPSWVKPILVLECNTSILSDRFTFSDLMADRVITFLDFIESSEGNFCIFIQDERGIHRAPAVAQIVKAVKTQEIKISYSNENRHPDPIILKLLTKKWSEGIARDAEKNAKRNGGTQ